LGTQIGKKTNTVLPYALPVLDLFTGNKTPLTLPL